MDDLLKNLSLQFNTSELNHLIGCAERVLGAGHWGSSDILIPEEQNFMAMLKKSRGTLNISPFYLKMLIDWMGAATGEGSALLPEDQSIIEKCRSVFEEYHDAVERDYRLRRGEIRSLKESFALMGIKVAVNKQKEKYVKGSEGGTGASVSEDTSYRREDYEEAVFGTGLETGNTKFSFPRKRVKNSLAKSLDAGKQETFFSRRGSRVKDIEIPGITPEEPEAQEDKKNEPISRLKRISNYLAQAFDAGRERNFSPGKVRYHKDTDGMKDHVEKAEKLQAYMKKKGRKF